MGEFCSQKTYGALLVFVPLPLFLGRLGPCGRDEGGVGLDPRVQREQTLHNRQQTTEKGREVKIKDMLCTEADPRQYV